VGAQHARQQRGLITRPSLAEVFTYRAAVDERMQRLMQRQADPALADLVELGLQHEQQHQELLLTDLLHLFSCNPLAPVYRPGLSPEAVPAVAPGALRWLPQPGGLVDTGHSGGGFAFDNETPRHRTWLEPHALAHRLVTNGEWAEFMADGGYAQPRWWLSAGWDWVRTGRIEAPLYWRRDGSGTPADAWRIFTLQGAVTVDPHAPVSHVSLYEADAYASWRAARDGQPLRLPTEAEWEHAAKPIAAAAIAAGGFVESGVLHPQPVAQGTEGLQQMFGELWQWTRSAYAPYPGFRPWGGAVGEYNAKFMANQFVLRGGSRASPRSHLRASYRNFFPADARWQFTGLRLARDRA
jgi:ergothioneine biosynthesis protein EgtB